MNSDPYDSAAWRSFGMLDADESAIFDEAMRHDPLLRDASVEMDRLSAAVAAACATPIQPKAGQLDRLRSRLNIGAPRGGNLWLGLSGWAAAAVLTVILVVSRSKPEMQPAVVTTPPARVLEKTSPAPPEPDVASTPPAIAETTTDAEESESSPDAGQPSSSGAEADSKAAFVRVETKRLVQEIEVLRESLEKYQDRDRALFEALPGKSLPIVMTMYPPGLSDEERDLLVQTSESAPMSTMLGDAMKMYMARIARPATSGVIEPAQTPELEDAGVAGPVTMNEIPLARKRPTAIPIYDPAVDAGTLVVSDLPDLATNERYDLWITPVSGDKPTFVGSLPNSDLSGVDSFDFALGSNTILPAKFLLTKTTGDVPAAPTNTNVVLEGPPLPKN